MPKIAVIEDDQPIRDMYKLKLEKAGYTVKVAADGIKGLEIAEKFQPDLILLDILIPQMSGDEMLEKMRATTWGKDTKVVILTNLSKDEAPAILNSLKVDRYIVKAHYTPSQVVKMVKEVLNSE